MNRDFIVWFDNEDIKHTRAVSTYSVYSAFVELKAYFPNAVPYRVCNNKMEVLWGEELPNVPEVRMLTGYEASLVKQKFNKEKQ